MKKNVAFDDEPAVRSALRSAVIFNAWGKPAAEDVLAIFQRGGVEDPDELAKLLLAFTAYFRPQTWAKDLRQLAMRNANLFSRMRAELREKFPDVKLMQIADLMWAIEIVGSRKLGIAFREGIRALRPMRDLVALIHLPHETLAASLLPGVDLDIYGIRSPGFFLGRVLYVGPDVHPEVKPGQLVMAQEQSMSYGAGELPSEDFGLEPGRRVILVPCKMLKSPQRSEELTERRAEIKAFMGAFPEDKYPRDHEFWSTPKGEAALAQQGEHVHNIMEILVSRGGKGRNRLIHSADENDKCIRCGFDLLLTPALLYCPRCGIPAQSCRTEAEGIVGIVEEEGA